MAVRLSTSGSLTPRRACPESHMPPDLNPEQAWAWALDNFPALSRCSCQCLQSCGEVDFPELGVERGQKRGRDACIQEPVAETAQELQSPQEEASATVSGVYSALNPSRGASAWSPGRPQKLLKTEAYIAEAPRKERNSRLADVLQGDAGHPVLRQEPERLQWGPSYCPCGLMHWDCALHA